VLLCWKWGGWGCSSCCGVCAVCCGSVSGAEDAGLLLSSSSGDVTRLLLLLAMVPRVLPLLLLLRLLSGRNSACRPSSEHATPKGNNEDQAVVCQQDKTRQQEGHQRTLYARDHGSSVC